MTRIRRRLDADSDDGAAMMFALLAMVIAMSLSMLMLGVLLSRVSPSSLQQRQATTIGAAEAGLDYALTAIRNSQDADVADDGTVYGNPNLLPCWTDKEMSIGNPQGVDLKTTVTIVYYEQDPTTLSDTQLVTEAMTCVGNSGVSTVPQYALIKAVGSGPQLANQDAGIGDRAMQTVYKFKILNRSTLGGLVRFVDYDDPRGRKAHDPPNEPTMCWRANGSSAGSTISINACDTTDAMQRWLWLPDATFQLSTSVQFAGDKGLCVSSPQVDNENLTLQICDSSQQKQRFGATGGNGSDTDPAAWPGIGPLIDGSHHPFNQFGGGEPVTTCEMVREWYKYRGRWYRRWVEKCTTSTPTLKLWGYQYSGGTLRAEQQWLAKPDRVIPDPQVGAGPVGANTGDNVANVKLQWANFGEYNRCLDITGSKITEPAEIAYLCKQPADPSTPHDWNQLYTWNDSTGAFFTYGRDSRDGNWKNLCMFSNGPSGGYVDFLPCPSNLPRNYQWTVYRETGVKRTSYAITDGYGMCLAVKNPDEGTPLAGVAAVWSTVVTEPCDGTPEQKWNAPPIPYDEPLNDTVEINPGD